MIWLHEEHSLIITKVDAFPTLEFWDFCASKCKDIPFFSLELGSQVSPHSYCKLQFRVIHNDHILFISRPHFGLNCWHLTYFDNHTYHIDLLVLKHFLNLGQRSKVKALFVYVLIILYFLDLSILIKDQTIIIADWGKPFVGYVYLSIGKQKYFFLSEQFNKLLCCIIEESCLDLCTISIHQVNVE